MKFAARFLVQPGEEANEAVFDPVDHGENGFFQPLEYFFNADDGLFHVSGKNSDKEILKALNNVSDTVQQFLPVAGGHRQGQQHRRDTRD